MICLLLSIANYRGSLPQYCTFMHFSHNGSDDTDCGLCTETYRGRCRRSSCCCRGVRRGGGRGGGEGEESSYEKIAALLRRLHAATTNCGLHIMAGDGLKDFGASQNSTLFDMLSESSSNSLGNVGDVMMH